MAYCGCATPSSKIRWGVMVLLLVLAVVFYIIMGVALSKCKLCSIDDDTGVRECSDYNGLRNRHEDGDGIVYTDSDGELQVRDAAELEVDCNVRLIAACLWLGVLALIGATIPCCINCCCAQPPGQKDGMAAMAYAMHAHQYSTPEQTGVLDPTGEPIPAPGVSQDSQNMYKPV